MFTSRPHYLSETENQNLMEDDDPNNSEIWTFAQRIYEEYVTVVLSNSFRITSYCKKVEHSEPLSRQKEEDECFTTNSLDDECMNYWLFKSTIKCSIAKRSRDNSS